MENSLSRTEWKLFIPKGWYHLFDQMCGEIDNITNDWEIVELKEKWGTMRCYIDTDNPIVDRNMLNSIVYKYERLSAKTCCVCGAPAKYITHSWVCPYCKDCIVDFENEEYGEIDND